MADESQEPKSLIQNLVVPTPDAAWDGRLVGASFDGSHLIFEDDQALASSLDTMWDNQEQLHKIELFYPGFVSNYTAMIALSDSIQASSEIDSIFTQEITSSLLDSNSRAARLLTRLPIPNSSDVEVEPTVRFSLFRAICNVGAEFVVSKQVWRFTHAAVITYPYIDFLEA